MTPQDGTVFEPVAGRWMQHVGRIRDVVRQTLVAEQLAEVLAGLEGPATARLVLDVGCGQGTQALHLARAGHEVVGLDPSSELLDRFRDALAGEPDEVRRRVRLVQGPGERAPDVVGSGFDLVLCHGVLMYLDDDAHDARMLAALTAAAAPRGRLSLLVRNGLGLAMRPGLLRDWAGVEHALRGASYTNRLGLTARPHTPQALDDLLAQHGLHRQAWWGVRVLTDHLDGDPPPPDELAALLRAESAVSACDPYRQVSALLHLVYGRPAGTDDGDPPLTG